MFMSSTVQMEGEAAKKVGHPWVSFHIEPVYKREELKHGTLKLKSFSICTYHDQIYFILLCIISRVQSILSVILTNEKNRGSYILLSPAA